MTLRAAGLPASSAMRLRSSSLPHGGIGQTIVGRWMTSIHATAPPSGRTFTSGACWRSAVPMRSGVVPSRLARNTSSERMYASLAPDRDALTDVYGLDAVPFSSVRFFPVAASTLQIEGPHTP